MVEQLLQPCADNQPAGVCNEDNEQFEQLDRFMMMYGSLHRDQIDWQAVETLCRQILQTQCKHYKVAVHLITCWLHKGELSGLADGFGLLAGLIDNYWRSGHPHPGNAGIKHRRRFVVQALKRLEQAMAKRQTQGLTHAQGEQLVDSATQLAKQLQRRKLDSPLIKLPEQLAALDPSPAAAADTAAKAPPGAAAVVANDSPDDQRQRKKQLLALAEHIGSEQPADPLAYQLRRYALWYGIQAVPPLDGKGESELMPPPESLLSDYQEQLDAGRVDDALLQRIEHSLTASPFWLSGNLLAARVAQQLGYRRVADEIQQQAHRFVQRLPKLAEARFKGGRPFLEGQPDVIESHPVGVTEAPGTSQALQSEIDQLYAEKGIAAVLEALEVQRRNASSPRQAGYLTLLTGEKMAQAGLNGLLRALIDATVQQVAVMPVAEWEPDYLTRLQKLTTEKRKAT